MSQCIHEDTDSCERLGNKLIIIIINYYYRLTVLKNYNA